jgi:hypothetical protein
VGVRLGKRGPHPRSRPEPATDASADPGEIDELIVAEPGVGCRVRAEPL